MTREAQLKDLEQGIQAYMSAFGSAPPGYRFPFLGETPAVLAALKAKNMTVMSVDTGIDDWAPNDMRTDVMVRRLLDNLNAKGGGIILMHDANGPTADALPAMLKALKDNGYKVVHVRWEQ
jgi:peptidoglycan/xylan/chitin deacetylase (PgdA/CDA1 family)